MTSKLTSSSARVALKDLVMFRALAAGALSVGWVSLTASQNIAHVPLEAACTAWTSWQRSCDCDDHSSMEGRDRVWDVTLGPDRRRRGVGNRWEWQVF